MKLRVLAERLAAAPGVLRDWIRYGEDMFPTPGPLGPRCLFGEVTVEYEGKRVSIPYMDDGSGPPSESEVMALLAGDSDTYERLREERQTRRKRGDGVGAVYIGGPSDD